MNQRVEIRDTRELPAPLEIEQSVLGTLMMTNQHFVLISGILEGRHFSEALHQDIFESIQAIITRGANANPVTVKMQMKHGNQTVGQLSMAAYLARCMSECLGGFNLVDHARTIKEAFLRRQLIGLGRSMTDSSFDLGDPIVLADEIGAIQGAVSEAVTELSGKQNSSGSVLLESYMALVCSDGTDIKHEGVPIGIAEIGAVLSERKFQPGRLYGMLSSSGEGKSSCMLQICYRALVDGHPVMLLSYDQSGPECVAQMVAQRVGIETRRQVSKDMTDKEFDRAFEVAQFITQQRFEVVDCDNTKDTAARLGGYARSFVKRNMKAGKTPLIVIDHMGTIKPDNEDRGADEGTKARNIGQQLKSLAKSLNSVVLVLQQRSGAGMKRLNPRPIKQDLYGGEAAVQPFDAIFYLYRAETHMQRQIETAADDKEADKIRTRFLQQFRGDVEDMAEIGTIKVRFGRVGERRKVRFEAQYTRYVSDNSFDEQREFFA